MKKTFFHIISFSFLFLSVPYYFYFYSLYFSSINIINLITHQIVAHISLLETISITFLYTCITRRSHAEENEGKKKKKKEWREAVKRSILRVTITWIDIEGETRAFHYPAIKCGETNESRRPDFSRIKSSVTNNSDGVAVNSLKAVNS